MYVSQLTADFSGEMPAPGNVFRINADGTPEAVVEGLFFPHGIAFDADGNLFVTVNSIISAPDAADGPGPPHRRHRRRLIVTSPPCLGNPQAASRGTTSGKAHPRIQQGRQSFPYDARHRHPSKESTMLTPPKLLLALISTLIVMAVAIIPASAQDVDIAFSSEKIDSYGFPELHVTFNGTTFDVPTEVEAGYHVVVLEPGDGIAAYVDFMQPPAGLAHEEAVEIALQAGAMDIVEPGWVFGGGSYAFENKPTRFIVYLKPGEWQIAASWQIDEDGAEETMELYPLTVTDHGVSTAGEMDPEPDVVMELNDFAFGGLDTAIPAGSDPVRVANVGEQPRQMVLFRTDRALTSDDFAAWFASMEPATPAAGTPDAATPVLEPFTMTWVGYAALTSPGYSTWIELDLEPGIYTATSWVIDPETGDAGPASRHGPELRRRVTQTRGMPDGSNAPGTLRSIVISTGAQRNGEISVL